MTANYFFDPVKARDGLIRSLRSHAESGGFSSVVIGISGGKDSTVAAALCSRALGKEHVLGVLLPDGEQKDLGDALSVVRALHIPYRVLNIKAIDDALCAAVAPPPPDGEFAIPMSRESHINVPPRLRMTVLRYVAQAMGARLVCTSNLSEITVGYCTKDGDTSGDLRLLAGLTSIEVVQVGLTLDELPPELVRKTPADGLSGVSDEEKLGLKYADIHRYIRLGTSGNPDADARIAALQHASRHKREAAPVISFEDC